MGHGLKTRGASLFLVSLICSLLSGCALFDLLFGIPAGEPVIDFAGGVRLRIENRSGLLARVEATYVIVGEDARQTSRVLQPDGPESTDEILPTRADIITVQARIEPGAVLPDVARLQVGDLLAEQEFRINVDFLPGDTLVFTIPDPTTQGEIIDCNLNQVADVLDISSGTSQDCNQNTIPDECEIDPAGQASGGPFFCDPAIQDCATDCNANGIPDSCEVCPELPVFNLAAARARSGVVAGAGAVIIGGDDLTDHGSVDNQGNPLRGWLYIERALENIRPLVTRAGNDGSIAALGSAPSTELDGNAGAAIGFAAAAAGIPVTYYEGAAAINQFFTDLDAGTVNPAILWTAGTGASNDLGFNEGQALTNHAASIANFVNSGGGLLSHGSGSTAYGWLTALLPDLADVNSGSSGDLTLTAEGLAAFPGVTDLDINAGPWHNHFEGDFQGLDILATSGDVTDSFGNPAAVIIGGAGVSLPSQITLDPETATKNIGEQHTVTATVRTDQGAPFSAVSVDFEVLTGGPNAGTIGSDVTDANGVATFSFVGTGGPGTDQIRASLFDGQTPLFSNVVNVTWEIPPCPLDCNRNLVPDDCETDTDGDGVIDDCDGCPLDSAKLDPGPCGCGVADDLGDLDEDGVPNCLDVCPEGDDTLDCNANGIPDACDDSPCP
ncbi:MAG: hypothetical protein ACE5E1_09330 [Phycisphaerae bacterium]